MGDTGQPCQAHHPCCQDRGLRSRLCFLPLLSPPTASIPMELPTLMESLLLQGPLSPTTRIPSTTPPKPLPLERLWENLLMLPRMEKLSMKFRREKLKLTPLFSTPDSPTPPPHTLLESSAPTLIPTTPLLSTLLSTTLPLLSTLLSTTLLLSRPMIMVLPPPLLELSTHPMLESASTMKVPKFPANCST